LYFQYGENSGFGSEERGQTQSKPDFARASNSRRRFTGVRISFGSDAHHPWQLLFLDLALAAAILADIPEERIINFMPAEELLKWVKSVRAS
jgi:histidinol phosphatase-like PHP family hydrolase